MVDAVDEGQGCQGETGRAVGCHHGLGRVVLPAGACMVPAVRTQQQPVEALTCFQRTCLYVHSPGGVGVLPRWLAMPAVCMCVAERHRVCGASPAGLAL